LLNPFSAPSDDDIANSPGQTTLAVPLDCDSCVESVSSAIRPLPGIHTVSADLSSQLVHISGTTAPSAVVTAIQSTGRDAILRGSGRSNNSAAVCILESHSPPRLPASEDKIIRGLARMVQISDHDPPRTLVDLTLSGMEPGTYYTTVRAMGDISRGAASTGSIWDTVRAAFRPHDARPRGYLGQVEVGRDGRGSAFLDREVGVSEVIGRAMVVSMERPDATDGRSCAEDDERTVVGVIARSAGVWDNDKTVCSCSGKNVWEEREEQTGKGMM
jgi:copper chaperone for superoxide dismutase